MMNTNGSVFLSFRRWTVIFGALLVLAAGSVYFFEVSAQTEKREESAKPAEQNLVNGKLAFTRRFSGPTFPEGRVVIANPDGSGQATLGTPSTEDVTQPAWSPDGTKLVFVSRQQNQDLYVINADGSGVLNLTNTGGSIPENNPSWSATGKIAYERGGQIWVINPDGTGNAQFSGITQIGPSGPAWSSDGSKLAFASGGEIWVINADGTGERRVTNNSTSDSDPAFSPDGSKIAFTKSNNIGVVNLDGTGDTTIAASGVMPSWSPDGTKIAFRRSGIYTMDADGTNQARVVADVINFPVCCDILYEYPAWQPVAQAPNSFTISGRISYNNLPVAGATVTLSGTTAASATTDAVGNYQFSGLAAGGNYTVTPSLANHIFAPTSRAFTNLSSNLTGNFEVQAVCVLPNRCVRNGKVAFVYNNDIYTINPDGTNQTNVTNNAATDREPKFSPTGSSIVFSTNRDGNYEIYRMNTDGSNPVRLTNNAASETSPAYSPDGNYIVFVSDRDGNSEIYRMNADGTNQINLTNDAAHDLYPTFSPDGQKIVFTTARNGSKIYSMLPDGSNQQQVSGIPTLTGGFYSLAYSPDGSKLTFGFSPDPSTTHPSVWTVNADGTNFTQLGSGNFPIFSPDGTKRAYVCCYFEPNLSPARLRVVDLVGGNAERILSPSPLNSYWSSVAWQAIPITRNAPFDYDGDGKADISVFRAVENKWYIRQSSTASVRESIFAVSGDVPVPADYDGDGKTDIAVFRPSGGAWWYLSSLTGAQVNVNWGQSGDVPRPSDFDGDGKTDFVVYRPSNSVWYRYGTTGVTSITQFGIAEDKPLVGDFDGDGKSDLAVFRPSTGDWWYAASSLSGAHRVQHWGQAGDVPAPGDYDADGRTDFVVFRPENGGWYILRTGEQNYTILQFGLPGDRPVAADFDGDGKTDVAVFRPSTGIWYLLQTTAGFGAVQWGNSTDTPTQSAFLP